MKRAIQVGLVKPVVEEATEMAQIDVEKAIKATFRGISNVMVTYFTYDTIRKIVIDRVINNKK